MNIDVSYKTALAEDDDWAQFEDMDDVVGDSNIVGDSDVVSVSASAGLQPPITPLEPPSFPPQLHPAVSLGIQRVSSCYLSLASEESVADLISQFGDDTIEEKAYVSEWDNSADVLYHDILMHVFAFLDYPSLTTFSETARRPNFEVFYFLQLQLQRALLVDPHCEEEEKERNHQVNHPYQEDSLSSIAGSSCLSRLASLDPAQAQATVNEYLESNSTLRTMPLSHSLAYFRHVLHQHGFHNLHPDATKNPPAHALASAALLVTVVGAASIMTGGDASGALDSFGTELPHMLFRVGFVGSLMGAARQMSDTEHRASMRETAEQMGRAMQELPSALLRKDDLHFHFPSLVEMRRMLKTTLGNRARRDSRPMLSNPYEHFPSIDEKKEEKQAKEEEEEEEDEKPPKEPNRKMGSGCVGAYSRALYNAGNRVTHIVKERRKAPFLTLSQEEQRQMSIAFLDACSSDDSLSLVKDMILRIDVDGFYMGSDGSETCALHTAAFHGADRVLDFLCRNIDDSDSQQDGGLAEVNSRDNNGWTALHFAAGANSVAAVQVLARHGAELAIEAKNGYTPMQWAIRLSNEQVANELKELSNASAQRTGWMVSQPLTTIANRFFALIPSH
jgi:hypothetical protein